MPRSLALCTLCLAAWSLRGTAFAGPSPAPSIPVVVLYVPDLPDRDEDDVLAASIAAQVDAGNVDLRVLRYDPAVATEPGVVAARSRRSAEEFAAGGVMWIRLATTPGQPHAVFLYEVSQDRVLGRRIPVPPQSPAAAIETVANIAGSIVAESLDGPVDALEELDPETLEAPEPEPAPPEIQPEPTPPETQPEPKPAEPQPDNAVIVDKPFPRLWLMAAYAGNTYADAPVWQHAVALAVAWGPARGAFIGLRYDFVIPSEVEINMLLVSVRPHPISLEGGYRFGLRERLDVELFGRVTVDPVTRSSGTGGTADALRLFSGLTAGVGFGYQPVPPIRLGLRIGAQVLTSRAAYVLVDGDSATTALDPHPARFIAEAGVHFGLLRRSRRSRSSGAR